METTMNPSPQTLPFKFHGKSGEYFRIWIVNVVLSILTLGIYSAWAKVRNKRYFYSNTELDGSTFEYLANPIAILKGRLLALGVFAVYLVTVWFFPLSELVFVLAFIADKHLGRIEVIRIEIKSNIAKSGVAGIESHGPYDKPGQTGNECQHENGF